MGAVMRKLVCVLLVLLGTGLLAGGAWAQEVGGSFAMTPAGSLQLGVRADWVFEQKMKDTAMTTNLGNQELLFSESDRLTGVKVDGDLYLAATGTYGLTDWLNLFAEVGLVDGGKLKMDSAEAKLGANFFWALGAKARVFESKDGRGLMLSARYLRYDNRELKDWRINGSSPDDLYGYSTDDQADYWQVDAAALVYWKLGRVTPYVGAAYTYCELRYDGKWSNSTNGATVTYDAKFRIKDQYLALAGLEVALGGSLSLNLQGAFGGRSEVGLGLSYRF